MNQELIVELDMPYGQAVERVTEALSEEGFGVLTRIDLHEAFAEKIGKSFRDYTILGACNPSLAYKAINTSPEVGMFLPCNVTVEEKEEGEGSIVRFLDPDLIMGQARFGEMPAMQEVAADAKERLERAAAAIRSSRAS